MTERGSNFPMLMLSVIETPLKLLQENFENYFTEEQNATLVVEWIDSPPLKR